MEGQRLGGKEQGFSKNVVKSLGLSETFLGGGGKKSGSKSRIESL